MPIVERIVKIYEDDFAYIVRPNSDTEGHATDIAYEEGDEEYKYICVTPDALPALIAALQERLEAVCRDTSTPTPENPDDA